MNNQSIVKLTTNKSQKHSYPSKAYTSSKSDVLHIDNVSEPELEVFLANPENNTQKAMIIAPGGALFFHAIEHEGREVAKLLAQKGINAFVLKYRLYPVDGNAEDYVNELADKQDWDSIRFKAKETFPFALDDATEALKHLKNNCDSYDISPSQIGMMGFSAGGALTLEAVFQLASGLKPNFIAAIYPWIDILSPYKLPLEEIPAFFDCATNDELFLAPQTVDLYKEWISADKKAELHMHESGGHGYGTKGIEEVSAWLDLLINWIIRR